MPITLLSTAKIPFYESLGWEIVGHPVMTEQPDGKIASHMQVMVLPSNGHVGPMVKSN